MIQTARINTVIRFHDPATFAAARAYVASLRWRLAVGAVFALGASLALDSYSVGFGWFLAVALSTAFDAMLGHSYLEARGAGDRRTAGYLFVWGCAFSAALFSAMTLHVAAAGGGPGRVLAVLMAASWFVSAMVFLFHARGFMTITAAPAVVALLAIPFLASGPSPADLLSGELGAACGVAGFLAYVGRAALHNSSMMTGLRAATRQARERQAEAEARSVEAEEANRAKSEFLTIMTHELRTPLNAVIGYAEIIQEDLQAQQGALDLAEDAGRITASARHLLGLIDQILSMTGAETAKVELDIAPCDLRALLEAAVAASSGEAQAAGNRVSLFVDAGLGRAHTDAGKLRLCVDALLSNAVKFTKNGLVAVRAEQDGAGAGLIITVSDTGLGIPAEAQQRIFDPFVQVEAAVTRSRGGVGLGLAITRRLAQALGGDISVVSTPGRGSTFTLRVAKNMGSRTAARAA